MSIIKEVIELVKENEVIDARKNIIKVVEEIKKFQLKTKTFIDDNFVDFLPNLCSNKLLLEEGDRLCKEVDTLTENIKNETKQDLLAVSEELQKYLEELEEISLGIHASLKILRIDELFNQIETSKTNNEYLNVMDYIASIKELIYDDNDYVLKYLDCYENIKIKYYIEHESLLHALKQKFESLVQMNERTFQKTKMVTLKISKDEKLLQETMVALMSSKYNPRPICDFLMDNIFEPIITKPVSIEYDKDKSAQVTLSLSYSLQPLADDLRPNYKIVLKNIRTAMKCLSHMNKAITDHVCVFGIFSSIIKDRFLNLLKTKCLTQSVPNTMDEMAESTMVADVHEFHQFLCSMEFLNEEQDTDLPEFANKIGYLFKKRFSKNIVDSAVEIMQKDLHDMVLVGESADNSDSNLKNVVTFARCMVSKNILEIISLMERVTREASTASGDLVERLLSTIPIIVKRYINEVPTHHDNMLLNIPQQTALFHNNCFYLAHWLLHQSTGIEMPAVIIINLHNCRNTQFNRQISRQRSQILQILSDFDISKTTSGIDPMCIKLIRQCLRQMELLKNVWQTVLQVTMYNNTIGSLLNDFCVEIIRRIVVVDDIPSPIADGLVEILTDIINRAPSLFQDSAEISIHVKSWQKLSQLKTILGTSMADIVEQWAEGKGVLSLNYKADEIKHLIRALFQNTDRRANALARII